MADETEEIIKKRGREFTVPKTIWFDEETGEDYNTLAEIFKVEVATYIRRVVKPELKRLRDIEERKLNEQKAG